MSEVRSEDDAVGTPGRRNDLDSLDAVPGSFGVVERSMSDVDSHTRKTSRLDRRRLGGHGRLRCLVGGGPGALGQVEGLLGLLHPVHATAVPGAGSVTLVVG